ncbi:YgjP-like metallopeptidase domain-containing protein [Psychrobacillus sp. MER TA 171]|uniref:YgjP-like metallopeptidase domain-containing protein n=1 Tax=Psychrobacillus sp. MER TA 171 TaxID=2939577 RepID=UPI002041A83C|nr:YgjP-like metallopeptidase domain-containing protein [Psychrobacillus sp. MER TA 171]MCM3359371.1 M48 family metallopeptidase [Psychrobacillus sp. MER TA 171]
MNNIQFRKNKIPYDLKWSNRRKTIAIAVDSNGVSVTAPTNTSQEKIDSAVHLKAPWIRNQLNHFRGMYQGYLFQCFLRINRPN